MRKYLIEYNRAVDGSHVATEMLFTDADEAKRWCNMVIAEPVIITELVK